MHTHAHTPAISSCGQSNAYLPCMPSNSTLLQLQPPCGRSAAFVDSYAQHTHCNTHAWASDTLQEHKQQPTSPQLLCCDTHPPTRTSKTLLDNKIPRGMWQQGQKQLHRYRTRDGAQVPDKGRRARKAHTHSPPQYGTATPPLPPSWPTHQTHRASTQLLSQAASKLQTTRLRANGQKTTGAKQHPGCHTGGGAASPQAVSLRAAHAQRPHSQIQIEPPATLW